MDVGWMLDGGNDDDDDVLQTEEELQKDLFQLNTCVALYQFTPQESHDLEMR